jgi:NAD(P)-dependent dehydrogenase (short-subunit alcohol dehydrogenase family)
MIAVITASYSAIGQSLTEGLLERGYKVIALNRNQKKSSLQMNSIKTANKDAQFYYLNIELSDPTSIQEAASRIREEYGEISVLINNAGYAGSTSPLLPNGIEQHFQVNTLAPLQLIKQLAFTPRGEVLNLGSSAIFMVRRLILDPAWHHQNFKKMMGPYAHSKLALTQLSYILSQKPEYSGLTIKTIDPGPTKSAMSKSDAMPGIVKLLRPIFNSPGRAARTVLNAFFNPAFTSGSFVQGNKVKPILPPTEQLIDWYTHISQTWQ